MIEAVLTTALVELAAEAPFVPVGVVDGVAVWQAIAVAVSALAVDVTVDVPAVPVADAVFVAVAVAETVLVAFHFAVADAFGSAVVVSERQGLTVAAIVGRE